MRVKDREKTIERIIDDIDVNLDSYRGFVLDCIRKEIEKWDDEDLLSFLGDVADDD